MKTKSIFIEVILAGLLMSFLYSCNKEEPKVIPTVTDADGNVYTTVTIGNQVWMVENLKTTKYRNGDPIPNFGDDNAWITATSGAYSNYESNENNSATYGRLYNWFAVNDSRNIAPNGWHVATEADWIILTTYLGGVTNAGGKLKQPGTLYWSSPNLMGDNQTGFSALPGGFRSDNGSYLTLGTNGFWWCTTEYSVASAWRWSMRNNTLIVDEYFWSKTFGCSVRCVKD